MTDPTPESSIKPQRTGSDRPPERSISLPTLKLAMVIIAACVVMALASIIASKTGLLVDIPIGLPLSASALVAFAMLGGLMIIGPWNSRPVGLWPTLWMASTVVRLLITPVLTYLLYSATPFGPTALALHVVAAYMLALLGEVIVLAGYLNRVFSA